MTQIEDSTAFSPRVEAWGANFTAGGFPFWTARDLPSATNLTTSVVANSTWNTSFNFDISQDADGNVNDNRNFYTQTSQGEYFTVTFQTNLTTPLTSTSVYVDQRTDVEVVSIDVNYGKTLVRDNSILYETILAADTDAWVLNSNGTTYDFTVRLDWNKAFGERPAYTLASTVRDTHWNGRLNLYVALTDGVSSTLLTHPTVNAPYRYDDLAYVQWIPAWTGWDGRSGYVGRPILDMKTGLPTFAEAVVEDEYHEGIWTVPAQWDPIDPRDVREVVFPDDEGTRKDDVPA
jgi:hypothetical protein